MPADYLNVLAELMQRIAAAQVRAARAVSRELVALYWHIGETIVQRQEAAAWGNSVVERLAHALRKVRDGGVAVLASCSHHLWEDRFEQVLQEAARWSDRRLILLMRGGQAPCHPIPTEVPEAGYLKCVLVRVERR